MQIGANVPPSYIPNKADLLYIDKTPADEIALVLEQFCKQCAVIN